MRAFVFIIIVGVLFSLTGCGKKDDPELKEITGVVFEDGNENGVLDEDEKRIKGVLVSNQFDVVKTDRKGRYRLPLHGRDATVFVIKPSEYRVRLNDSNLPQFYYVHRPEGSPELEDAAVPATGKLPESVDFPLYKTSRTDAFDVVVFADPQPRSNREIDYIRDDVIAELVGSDAAFGFTLGDITYDDLSLYDRYNSVVSAIGIPFYNVAGNHDINQDAEDDRYALETFRRQFGPTYYAFEYGKVNFIVLDDVEWLGQTEDDQFPYRGQIGNRQRAWVKNYLKYVPSDHLVVLAMHIPLYSSQNEDANVNVADRDELFDILKKRNHLLVITGHMHTIEQNDLDDTIGWDGKARFQQITCASVSGSWWTGPKDARGIPTSDQPDGTPNGYHMFSFKGNKFTQRYQAAGYDTKNQIRISAPAGVVADTNGTGLTLVANVFNGNEHSTVEYRLGGADPLPMGRTVRIDPFIENLLATHPKLFRDWIEALPSTHIWTAAIPAGLAPGTYTVTVRAVDEYGNEFSKARVFEIR